MKILIAPGSYKSTLTSTEAGKIIADAARRALPSADVDRIVITDGGEGTLDMFSSLFGATTENRRCRDPLGRWMTCNVGFLPGRVAILESSQIVGYSLLDDGERDPFVASSVGVADLLKQLVSEGINRVLVTMGDSTIMDLGVGMLYGLGVRFRDSSGVELIPSLGNLDRVRRLDATALRNLREKVHIECLVDTDDYLCGADGQVQLYGAQKGLGQSDIPRVESAYRSFCSVVHQELGCDLLQLPRATGSGGLAAAFSAFFGADLTNTLEFVSARSDIESRIRGADIVITGEGCLDNQTRFGKVPYFVARRTSGALICVCGRYTDEGASDIRRACDRSVLFTTNPDFSVNYPSHALAEAATDVFRLIALTQ